jgi:hypothetical protein
MVNGSCFTCPVTTVALGSSAAEQPSNLGLIIGLGVWGSVMTVSLIAALIVLYLRIKN